MSDSNSPQLIRPLPQYLPVDPFDVNLSPDGGKSHDASLKDLLRVVLRYRILVSAVAIFSVLISLLYALLATPLYRASTVVRISTYEPVLSATKVEDVLSQKSRETSYIETQLKEMTSLSLADHVLSNQTLLQALSLVEDDPALGISGADQISLQSGGGGYRHPVKMLKAYSGLIKVEPIRRTSLVTLSATTKSAELSADVANAHARAYIEWVKKSRIEQQSEGLKFLRTQELELKEKVADLEREIAEYAEEHSIVAINKDENITVQRMSQFSQLLTDATDRRIEAENTYKEAEAAMTRGESAGFDDESVRSARSDLAKLEAEYGSLSAKFLPTYPKMIQLKAQISQLHDSIDAQRKQVVSGLKAKMLAAQEKEAYLKDELEKQKSHTFELSKSQVQYNILNRELDTSRELLQNVLKQIKETSLAVQSNASNVSIVDLATAPTVPTFPHKRTIVLTGLLLGVIAGLALAFILNYFDNSIATPEELVSSIGVPALGVVPSFESEQAVAAGNIGRRLLGGISRPRINDVASGPDQGGASTASGDPTAKPEESGAATSSEVMLKDPLAEMPVIYLQSPKSLVAEAYRTIRTALMLSQAGEPPRTLLLSSAQSSEGKTTSTLNLAATLASSGGKVIVVDADLRRPSVHRYFKLRTGLPGLVEVLTGHLRIDEVYYRDLMPGVTIVTSGKIPPNPAELLGSRQMAELVDYLATQFDYVLIDSPPILPVTDSVILSRYVDGVLLVVKGSSTPRKVVRDASERLKGVGARVLGAILNNVNIRSGDYYYYNRYYYSYYRRPEEEDQIAGNA